MHGSPADIVIEKFGGHRMVAEILRIDLSRVYRWTYSPEQGGTGGTIPQKHQIRLLNSAQEKGIQLSPSDFFALEDASFTGEAA